MGLPSRILSAHVRMRQGLGQEPGKNGTTRRGCGWQPLPPHGVAGGTITVLPPPNCSWLHSPHVSPVITPFPFPVPSLKSLSSKGAYFVYFLMNTHSYFLALWIPLTIVGCNAGNPRSMCQYGQVLDEGPLPDLQEGPPSSCILTWQIVN